MGRLDNAEFTWDPEIAAAVDRWAEDDQRGRDLSAEFERAMMPTDEELEVRHLVARRAADTAGVDEGMVRRVEEQRVRKLEIARRFLDDRLEAHAKFSWPDLDFNAPPPPPPSRDFWWARTDWYTSSDFRADARSDGLVFTGGPNGTPHSNWLGDTDLIHAHFGAVAMFEITPDRLPPSPTGRWLSEPFVDLFGGLLGRTTSGSFPGGDSWSKCWLHLDHQLFQWGFGANGPAPLIRGQAHAVDQLLNEANADRTFGRPLAGFTPLPSIMFDGLILTQSLWARLEIRVDVQIEGAGSFLWCDPVVRLVTRHWPLRVIA